MMSDFYKANDDILFIKVNETYYPIACLTSNSFSENSETIDTTTRDNLGWKTSRPTNQSFSVDFEGIETLEDIISDKVTYKDLQGFKRNKTLVDFRIGTTKIIQGQGYIIDLSKDSPVDELVSFSGSLEGFGEYTEFAPADNNVLNYDLNFNI